MTTAAPHPHQQEPTMGLLEERDNMRSAIRLTIADASFHLRKYRPHCLEALVAVDMPRPAEPDKLVHGDLIERLNVWSLYSFHEMHQEKARALFAEAATTLASVSASPERTYAQGVEDAAKIADVYGQRYAYRSTTTAHHRGIAADDISKDIRLLLRPDPA